MTDFGTGRGQPLGSLENRRGTAKEFFLPGPNEPGGQRTPPGMLNFAWGLYALHQLEIVILNPVAHVSSIGILGETLAFSHSEMLP